MKMSPVIEQFVLHWGKMGPRWGVNRTVAQIHALLYVSGRPMHAEEIAETLDVARSNVGQSLKVLQNWDLLQTMSVLADRREYFKTYADVWILFKAILKERRQYELAPTCEFLNMLIADPIFSEEEAEIRLRILNAHSFSNMLLAWLDDMLELDDRVLIKILQLGSRLQNLPH